MSGGNIVSAAASAAHGENLNNSLASNSLLMSHDKQIAAASNTQSSAHLIAEPTSFSFQEDRSKAP